MKSLWPIAATMLLAGCAASPRPAPTGALTPTAVERGRTFVQRACAGCHAIGTAAQSPNPSAPPFWRLGRELEGAQLQAALAAVSRQGHNEMPPIAIVDRELGDVAQYIRSLQPPTRPDA